jgi:hypothetical protein
MAKQAIKFNFKYGKFDPAFVDIDEESKLGIGALAAASSSL